MRITYSVLSFFCSRCIDTFQSDAVDIAGQRVITRTLSGADIEELVKVAAEFCKELDVVALLTSDQEGAKIVAAAGDKALKNGANSGDLVREMSKVVGGLNWHSEAVLMLVRLMRPWNVGWKCFGKAWYNRVILPGM